MRKYTKKNLCTSWSTWTALTSNCSLSQTYYGGDPGSVAEYAVWNFVELCDIGAVLPARPSGFPCQLPSQQCFIFISQVWYNRPILKLQY